VEDEYNTEFWPRRALNPRVPPTQVSSSITLDKQRADCTIQVHHRLLGSPGNCGEGLGKIIPRYRTFQYRKCLGVLRMVAKVSMTER
jgi:hypothetical protein